MQKEIELKAAVKSYIESIDIPEKKLEELFLDQKIEKKAPVIINIFLFVFGMWLLLYGILKTYEFASQKDPHKAVQERYYQNKTVR